MRNFLFLALALTGACKWTEFDDLEGTTWARSTQAPDIGSTDYAVAIAGVSSGTSGGTLAVLSDDNASFSTIVYSAKGADSLGPNPIKLGTENIGALADVPAFATDATGKVALIERSILGGAFAVVFGTATAPAALEITAMATPAPTPDAAVFVPGPMGNDLVFAAGSTLYTIPAMGAQRLCQPTDNKMLALQVAAMDTDGTNLWVWTKSGFLISYPLGVGGLADCNATIAPRAVTFPPDVVTPTPGPGVPPLVPSPGARVHIVGGPTGFAILTGHPSGSRSGSVVVVRLVDGAAMTPETKAGTQVGTTLTVEGLQTSTLAVLGGQTYLAVGVPDRAVDGVTAGEVDLDAFNTTTGALSSTPELSLHDAQPDSGQLFGRTITTMSFNGSPILVVGGKSEIYAYYRTALYDNLP